MSVSFIWLLLWFSLPCSVTLNKILVENLTSSLKNAVLRPMIDFDAMVFHQRAVNEKRPKQWMTKTAVKAAINTVYITEC